jgi:hypothetical protein
MSARITTDSSGATPFPIATFPRRSCRESTITVSRILAITGSGASRFAKSNTSKKRGRSIVESGSSGRLAVKEVPPANLFAVSWQKSALPGVRDCASESDCEGLELISFELQVFPVA